MCRCSTCWPASSPLLIRIAYPPLRDALSLCHPLRCIHQLLERLGRHVRYRGYVVPGDDQYVYRRLFLQVLERHQVLFLV